MSIVNNRVSSASLFDCSVDAVDEALEKVRLARQVRQHQVSAQLVKAQQALGSSALRHTDPMPWLGEQAD